MRITEYSSEYFAHYKAGQTLHIVSYDNGGMHTILDISSRDN